MKKLFAIAAALFCMMGVSFADEAADLLKPKEDTLTRTIVPADQHVTNKTAIRLILMKQSSTIR